MPLCLAVAESAGPSVNYVLTESEDFSNAISVDKKVDGNVQAVQ